MTNIKASASLKIDESGVATTPKVLAAKAKPAKKATLSNVDLNELCSVQSCFYGELIYRSHIGYRATWAEYGTLQYLPVSELITMRNEQPKFFASNFVKLVGENCDSIMNFLQIEKYYKPLENYADFDELLKADPKEITQVIEELSDSAKETVARRAFALIEQGELDSKKTIDAIEAATKMELTE